MNFIKKLIEKKIDDEVHRQFIRFGKGEFGGRFLLGLRKTSNIKLKTSFEFANDLVALCASFGDCKISGLILSKEDISKMMSANNIKCQSEPKRGGLYYQNNIDSQDITKEKLVELEKVSYVALLDIEGAGFKLKTKKKLPKPGKSESKIDDKFCQLEADEKYYPKIKEDLFWDTPEAKKVSITHKIIVKDIIQPKGETDYAKVREMAKRKGQMIRKITADEKESLKEIDFEA
jgi:hypothetical protein